jgi:glycosyltransferase involved in cell wall biosynthesis
LSLRVAMLSKALVTGIYQRKLEAIAQQDVELLALVPPAWRDERGTQALERTYTAGYTLETLPIILNGNFHLHVYRGLRRRLAAFAPDIVHIDEEPYNAATWQAMWAARSAGARTVVFSWQNILRGYPPPFRWGEATVLRHADALIAGTASAAEVWRAKRYRGPIAVIPQFGTDNRLFMPAPTRPDRPFTFGYIGRLVPEKGIAVLLLALAQVPGDWRLRIVGGGPQRAELLRLAGELGIGARVHWGDQVPSTAMPAQYHTIDALVLPSLTTPAWKEQFGRVLVEAMASGVPVIASDSGAIPGVVGDAALITPEGDADALATACARLAGDPALARELRARGLLRAADFTHEAVANETVALYHRVRSAEQTRG